MGSSRFKMDTQITNTPQNVACAKMLYELLAFCQLQLRGHAQKCWRNFLSGCAAGRRTAGKPPPLRNSRATLDIQVILSSYTAPSRFYPPFLWIIYMWCPFRLWQTLYSVHPASIAPSPAPNRQKMPLPAWTERHIRKKCPMKEFR